MTMHILRIHLIVFSEIDSILSESPVTLLSFVIAAKQ